MAERARIATYFAPLAKAEPGSFQLTDDAAVLGNIVATTDSVIEGVHVLPGATPAQIARKLVRRNLSDLAAMGAKPWRYLVNLHTPFNTADEWFAAFAETLADEQKAFEMVLIGGDSTSGGRHVHATMTCLGQIEGTALLRSTAQVGDDIYVSGTIGDAAMGLRLLQQNSQTNGPLVDRYHTPQPRLELGQQLHGIASACMDISDGLLSDAHQLAQASGAQLCITRAQIPLSSALEQEQDFWSAVLTGGDDYELLFTAPVSQRSRLSALDVTRIGTVKAGSGVLLDGAPAGGGFEHR